jgi:hypothetical protein
MDTTSTLDKLMTKVSITESADYAEYLDKSMKEISLMAANTDGEEILNSIQYTKENSIWTRKSMKIILNGAQASQIHSLTNHY